VTGEDVYHFARKHVRISCESNKQIIMIHSSSSSAVRDKSKKTKVLDIEQRDSPCQLEKFRWINGRTGDPFIAYTKKLRGVVSVSIFHR
jgi:hypothetical protein